MESKKPIHIPTLEALTSADFSTLKACYLQLEGAPTPKSLKCDLLRAHLTWTIQAQQQKLKPGALRQRLLKMAEKSDQSPAQNFSPGTHLIREWQGETHEVTILENGYLYQGRQYQSLSGIAKDITGAHWSGPRFFRMVKEKVA